MKEEDGIFLSRNNLRIINFFSTLCISLLAFIVFQQNIETLGTDKEWKFYASLIGFIGLFSMFLLSTISSVIYLIRKSRDKLNNAS